MPAGTEDGHPRARPGKSCCVEHLDEGRDGTGTTGAVDDGEASLHDRVVWPAFKARSETEWLFLALLHEVLSTAARECFSVLSLTLTD